VVEEGVGHGGSPVQVSASIAAPRERSNPRAIHEPQKSLGRNAESPPRLGPAIWGKEIQEDFMNVLATGRRIAPALTRYGSTAVGFHWAVAALVVFLGTLGLLFDDIPKESRPFWINVHGCVGLIYFALVIARLVWRTSHKPPELPLYIGQFDRRISLAAHHLLYALMVLIPIFGFVAFVWHGRAFNYGFAELNFGVASNPDVFHPAETIHQLLAYCLFGVAALHAAAALYHHFVRRDGVLLRMLPGGTG
jgi:cytochrome b561